MDTKSSTEVSTKGNCYLNDDAHNTKMTLQPKENFSAKAQRRAAEKNRSSSLFDIRKGKTSRTKHNGVCTERNRSQ